jgi:hypothetical protein
MLLELAHHLDQYVLRGEVGLANRLDSRADALRHVCDAPSELSDDDVVLDRALRNGRQLRAGSDRLSLTVRHEPQRYGALGDGCGRVRAKSRRARRAEGAGPEQRTDHGPMGLLSNEGQVDELEQDRLQFMPTPSCGTGSAGR